MPLPPTPADELAQRAVLLLLLLARAAELPLDQIDSAGARATVVRGLARTGPLRHRTTSGRGSGRPWTCRRRWAV